MLVDERSPEGSLIWAPSDSDRLIRPRRAHASSGEPRELSCVVEDAVSGQIEYADPENIVGGVKYLCAE